MFARSKKLWVTFNSYIKFLGFTNFLLYISKIFNKILLVYMISSFAVVLITTKFCCSSYINVCHFKTFYWFEIFKIPNIYILLFLHISSKNFIYKDKVMCNLQKLCIKKKNIYISLQSVFNLSVIDYEKIQKRTINFSKNLYMQL